VSESEWETDTDPPTDDESVNNTSAATAGQDTPTTGADKSQDSVKASEGEDSSATNKENTSEQNKDENGKESEESKETLESEDGKKIPLNSEVSHDDVLKLDASAEVDEFSKFLNEFEEEILNEKKVEEKKEETTQKIEKKTRIQTERKSVDGKKMRKKIKPKRDGTPSFSDDDSHPGKHQQSSQSPGGHAGSRDRPGQAGFDRGSGGQNRYSKDRPRFSAERGGGRDSRGRDDNNRGSRPRDADSSRPQQIRETSSERRERERKEYEERKEKERKEYEDRLSKLPSPEREKMEARRRKFEARGELELNKPKKISLKRDTVDSDSEEDARSKLSFKKRDGKTNLQVTEKSDNRRRERSLSPSSEGRNKPHVTDLRVQLHKKKQLSTRVGGGGATTDEFEKPDRKSADRNARKSTERNGDVGLTGRKVTDRRVKEDLSDYEDLDLEDERVPPITSTHRVIMPPMFTKDEEKGKEDDASDRSPSPPNKGGRRVKIKSSSIGADEDIDLAKFGFTEEELQKEMKKLQRKNKKKEKKEKKEKKRLKKKKKSSKSKLDKIDSGSAEEGAEKDDFMDELDHFEKMLEEGEDFRSRSKSGSRSRNSSGEKSSSSRSRHSSSLSDEMKLSIRATSAEKWKGVGDSLGSKLKQRLGHKVKEAKAETELEPLGSNKRKLKRKSRELKESDGEIEEVSPKLSKKNKKRLIQSSSQGQFNGDEENEDLIAKMAKKNKKRLERAKEIEMDRLMHS